MNSYLFFYQLLGLDAMPEVSFLTIKYLMKKKYYKACEELVRNNLFKWLRTEEGEIVECAYFLDYFSIYPETESLTFKLKTDRLFSRSLYGRLTFRSGLPFVDFWY